MASSALAKKENVVSIVKEVLDSTHALVAADYRGLTVAEVEHLRALGIEHGVVIKVLKNRLAKIAFADTDYASVNDKLKGPSIFAFAKNDPGSIGRVFKQFIKEQKSIDIKFIAIADTVYDASSLDSIANLPDREGALAMVLAMMQSPVINAARVLNAIPASLVTALSQVAEKQKKESSN